MTPQEIEISGEAVQAMAFRLLSYMTHYRKPFDFTYDKLAVAEKTYRKWMSRIEGDVNATVPLKFLEAICDDINTPKCIAIMHEYSALKDGKNLFACMGFLGLIPGWTPRNMTDQEIKTPPLPEVLQENQPMGLQP